MKRIGLLLFAIGFTAASCSSDDSNNGNNGDAETIYLPLTNGNYWVYDVPGSIQDGRDSLYVANDTVIAGKTYKKLRTASTPFGFFSGALSNNAVRVSGDEILLSGTAALPFSMDIPVNIAVSDFVIFKENASNNALLDEVSGTFTQQFEGFPLTFDYTLTTRSRGDLSTYSINGHEYNNVKKVETVLELTISTVYGTFPITILPEQNVVTSLQYYAEGVGVVHVDTDLQYQLASLASMPGVNLPVPQSASESQEEKLEHYSVE